MTANPTERVPGSRYRADVDGLRAVAIGLVLLFHVDPALVPNGYIGVDVFFVISGYVVTLATLARGDQGIVASVLAFWQRRLLRIYPALLACVLVTLLMALALLPSFPLVVYLSFVRSAIAATIGAANIYLHRSQLDYFLADQSFNPFLHTWSLGVEEQFYLLFSVIFIAVPIAIAKLPAAGAGWARTTRWALLGIATALSAAAFIRVHTVDPIGAYYLLPYRFWELGIGSLLALTLPVMLPVAGRCTRLAAAAGQIVALSAIAIVAARPSDGHAFDAATIVIAAASAAAVIGLGALGGGPAARLLSTPMMVGAGQLSYSIYLWHWPVFIAFALTVGMHSAVTIAAALALVAGAAWLSYVSIERPFRSRATMGTRPALTRMAMLTFAVAAVAVLAHLSPGRGYFGAARAWTSDWLPAGDFAYAADGRIRASPCDATSGREVMAGIPPVCTAQPSGLASGARVPSLMLVGDSIAFADWGMLVPGVAQGRFRLHALDHNGCNVEIADARKSDACRQYWSAMPAVAQANLAAGDAVLIATSWSFDPAETHEHAVQSVTRFITATAGVGATVIIQAPLPRFAREAYFCTPEWFRSDFTGCSVARDALLAARGGVMAALQALADRHPNVRIWDPLDAVCPTASCGQFVDGRPLFRDRVHLSYYGAVSLAPAFLRFFSTTMARHG